MIRVVGLMAGYLWFLWEILEFLYFLSVHLESYVTSRLASKKPPISNSKMLKGDLGGYASLQQLSMQQIIKFGLGSMKKATWDNGKHKRAKMMKHQVRSYKLINCT